MDPLQLYLSRPWVKFYQPGVPSSVEFQARPVFQLFDEAAARWPGRDALVFYGRGITYRELSDAIDRLSCALAELGVRKGHRVAIYLVNSPQFVIAYFAALPYTGGTTGHPKGVMLTHANMVAAQALAKATFPAFVSGKEVVVAFLPFFHIYGQIVIMLNGLAQGHLLVLFTCPDTEAILSAMERYQATVFFGVPTLFEYLKDHKDTDKVNWRRLKLVLSGADTLHETTTKGWARRTGSSITEGYGLSETCAMSHVNPVQRPKAGSFGCPVPDVLAAVIDPESLAFIAPGQTGELVLSGPSVMAGYWRRPEETARTFIERDGRRWLRTGDIVRMDEEGYFHFYDRSKDLIKCKGYSVFAKDVEEVLYAHPDVKAAGVIGVPDPALGQRIKAIVVLQADARRKVDEEQIQAY